MAKETVIDIKTPDDPMKQLVTVYLPRATGKEENFLFVALNGKGYNIMRGQQVMVPKPVADIIAERERQIDRRDSYADALNGVSQ